jgi:hypothetical protein
VDRIGEGGWLLYSLLARLLISRLAELISAYSAAKYSSFNWSDLVRVTINHINKAISHTTHSVPIHCTITGMSLPLHLRAYQEPSKDDLTRLVSHSPSHSPVRNLTYIHNHLKAIQRPAFTVGSTSGITFIRSSSSSQAGQGF